MNNQQIDFELLPLRLQRCRDGYIRLKFTNEHVTYMGEFIASEPIIDGDPDAGWEERNVDFRTTILRQHVVGVEFSYSQMSHVYSVTMKINGSHEDITTYTKSRKQALTNQRRILEWIMSGELPAVEHQ